MTMSSWQRLNNATAALTTSEVRQLFLHGPAATALRHSGRLPEVIQLSLIAVVRPGVYNAWRSDVLKNGCGVACDKQWSPEHSCRALRLRCSMFPLGISYPSERHGWVTMTNEAHSLGVTLMPVDWQTTQSATAAALEARNFAEVVASDAVCLSDASPINFDYWRESVTRSAGH